MNVERCRFVQKSLAFMVRVILFPTQFAMEAINDGATLVTIRASFSIRFALLRRCRTIT